MNPPQTDIPTTSDAGCPLQPLVDEWLADDTLPTRRPEPDETLLTRRMVRDIELRPGDELRI